MISGRDKYDTWLKNCIDLKIQYFTDVLNILFRNNCPAKFQKTLMLVCFAPHTRFNHNPTYDLFYSIILQSDFIFSNDNLPVFSTLLCLLGWFAGFTNLLSKLVTHTFNVKLQSYVKILVGCLNESISEYNKSLVFVLHTFCRTRNRGEAGPPQFILVHCDICGNTFNASNCICLQNYY